MMFALILCLKELQLVKTFCRGSWSNFIVPAKKFLKIVDYPFCIGMRFKARVESEDASERRLYSSSLKRTSQHLSFFFLFAHIYKNVLPVLSDPLGL